MSEPLILRPSAASRWIACPASALLSKDIPPTPSGDAAMAGTAIHALAETCYLLDDDPMNSVGQIIEDVRLAKWHCEMAAEYLQHIRQIEAKCDKGAVRVEEKVTYVDSDQVLLRGTADLVGIGGKTLYIADLKTGQGYVDADNDQLKIYALGAMMPLDLHDIDHVELHIVQPRHGDVRVHSMTKQELIDWERDTLMPAIKDAIDPTQKPRPSEKACQYCPAKLICPAQREALAVIEAQPNVTAMNKDQIKDVMVRLSDEQISDLLDRAPIVEAFVDALRKHALERMKDGGTLPGWQLAPKRATRKWASEAAAKDALIEAGLSVDKLYITEFISPAAVEKLLAKEQKGILEDLTVKESSGVTIARDASLRQ